MGGKKKKGKKKKGPKEEPEPDDDYMKKDGATLEKDCQMLKEKLNDAKIKRNLIQIEKDMIHDFYTNTKNEMGQIEAEVKNYESRMEDLEEAQRTEIKVYMQKVKHLEYDHKNSLQKVELESKTVMKEENDDHTSNESQMRKEKGQLK